MKKPDISFDLDGDGYVGNKDYVFGKLFDKDGDGKLNAEERKNAEDALKAVSEFKDVTVIFYRVLKINSSGTLNSLVLTASSEFFKKEASLLTLRTTSPLQKPILNIHFRRLCQTLLLYKS